MPIAREVIIENILFSKYQEQAITAALNGEDALMLMLTALRKSWIYQMLPFIVNRDTLPIENNVPDGDVTGVLKMNFISDEESEIVNQSSLLTNSSEN